MVYKTDELKIELVLNVTTETLEGWSSTKETADKWGLTDIAVRQMVNRKQIKFPNCITIGSRIFIRSDLEKPTKNIGAHRM